MMLYMGNGMSKKKGTKNWSVEKLKKEALKFSKKKDFKKQSFKAYRAAQKRGLLDQLCSNMEPNLYNVPWTKEDLKKEALKYNSRNEFKKNYEGAYVTARKLKIMEDICAHMAPPQIKYTDEEIEKEAKKFNTRRKFKLGNSSLYRAALRRGPEFMNFVCSHMKKSKGTSIEEERVLSLIKKHYPNAKKVKFYNKDLKFRQKSYELDIYVPELKKGIEFDGSYWHSPEVLAKHKNISLEEAGRYHETKDEFFKTLGIEVFHIKEEDWLKNSENVKEILGLFLNVVHGTSMRRTSRHRRQWSETIKLIQEELGGLNG